MKKIISFLTLALVVLCANAEEKVYLESCPVQSGATAQIKVMVKHDSSKGCIGSLQFNYSFAEGIVVKDNGADVVGVGATTVNDQTNFVLLGGLEATTKANPDGACVCTFNITIPEGLSLGEHAMSISNVQAVYEDGVTDFTLEEVESTMTVQRTAIYTPMPDGYSLEVLPFIVEAGAKSVDVKVNLTNAEMIDDISFSLDLPSFMSPKATTKKIGKKTYSYVATTNLDAARIDNDASTFTIYAEQDEETGLWSYSTVNSDGDAFLKSTDGSLAFTIAMDLTGSQEAGVYTIKMSDIIIEAVDKDYDPIENLTGESLTSAFVGVPTETDPVVYGTYLDNDLLAALNNGVTTNFITVEVSQAKALAPIFGDALNVFSANNKAYYWRKNLSKYSTLCLPFEIASTETCKLYTLKSIDEKSAVFEEAETVEANTPVVYETTDAYSMFDGTMTTLSAGSKNGLVGTYEPYTLAKEAGYYLSGNAFHNDGAEVRPFRAYIPTVGGAKSLSIYLETANGIINITDQLSNEDIYSLQGIKLNKTQKGINIVGGKKIYNK